MNPLDNLGSNAHEIKIPIEAVREKLMPILVRHFKMNHDELDSVTVTEKPRTAKVWQALGHMNDAGILLGSEQGLGVSCDTAVEITFPRQEMGRVKALQQALISASEVVTTFNDSNITFMHNSNKLHKTITDPAFDSVLRDKIRNESQSRG